MNIFIEYVNIFLENAGVNLLYIFLPKSNNDMWD